MQLLFVIICTLLAITSRSDASFEDCATNILTVQNAIFDENGYNSYQLNLIFFPASAPSSRFIRVVYSFFNENNELDGCNVTYVWSIGEVLLAEPPTIFKYLSLYFNYPNNRLDFLYMRLPYECRGLVNTSSGDECSCENKSDDILEAVTQQISVYGKFTSAGSVERIETTARAVCTSNLQSIYYEQNYEVFYVLVCTTTIIPIVIILVLYLVFRGLPEGTATGISKSRPSFVSLVIIGVYVSTVIFIFDTLVCHAVVTSGHEYADYVDSGSFNLQINYVTLFIDTFIFLLLMLCLLYILYYNIKLFFGIQKQFIGHSYVLKFIVLFIGKKNSKNFRQLSENDIIAAIFPIMLFLPIISFSSHCIYILLAWLTEPEKASVILLTYYILIIIFFYSFKAMYESFSSVKLTYKKKAIATEVVTTELKEIEDENESPERDLQSKIESNPENPDDEYLSHDYINTQAFCITLMCSTVVVFFAIMVALMFIFVPFHSVSLIDYVVNVFQIVILILSSQLALQVIFKTSFDINNFIEIFINAIRSKEKLKNDNVKAVVRKKEELYKVAGVITAEVTSTILDLAKSPEQN